MYNILMDNLKKEYTGIVKQYKTSSYLCRSLLVYNSKGVLKLEILSVSHVNEENDIPYHIYVSDSSDKSMYEYDTVIDISTDYSEYFDTIYLC